MGASFDDDRFIDALSGGVHPEDCDDPASKLGMELRKELWLRAEAARIEREMLEALEAEPGPLVAAGPMPAVLAEQMFDGAASQGKTEGAGSLWQRLTGLLGLGGAAGTGVGGGGASGATIWGVPVAALATLALLAVALWPLVPRPVTDDSRTLRSAGGEVEVVTSNPAAKCDEIKGVLAGAGVTADQLRQDPLADGGCAITVRAEDPAQQQRIKEALSRVRVEIEASAKMDFSVIKGPAKGR